MKNSNRSKVVKTSVSAVVGTVNVSLSEEIELPNDSLPEFVSEVKLNSVLSNLATLNNFVSVLQEDGAL